MPSTAIVLAAGEGTRMKSNHAKVAHKILGKEMICWVVDAAAAGGCDQIVVVVGSHADEVRAIISDHYGTQANNDSFTPQVICVEQKERLGTAHAVRVALDELGSVSGPVVVLNGDLPLIESATIAQFVEAVADKSHAAAVLTMVPPDPFGYGRVELAEDGSVLRIIEQKDCTPEQAATLTECNAGCYAFDGEALTAHIGEVGCNNAQSEYYLPDMVQILRNAGETITSVCCKDYREGLGINSRAQLAELTALARDRINLSLMDEGVTFLDPTQAWIGPDCTVGRDTIIWPQTHLIGSTHIGEDCQIGPNSRLTDTSVADNCKVEETVALSVCIEEGVTVGPRAYLRPGTHLLAGAHVGTHVEIKNSTIGEGSKVPHLSYIGDTTMGSGVNIGAGSITCNYDGVHKHRTTIGNDVFVGSDTMMVAPVSIGDGALVGASSCITKDIPAGALALERSNQRIVEGYAAKRLERLKKGQE